MANTCMARILVERMDTDATNNVLPLGDLEQRLEALHYEFFDVLTDDGDEYFEVSCGFRWSPPFDRLLDITTDLHVRLRCVYEEEGCCFMGAWRAADGKVLQDDCIDYC